jgi:hypothetical protein
MPLLKGKKNIDHNIEVWPVQRRKNNGFRRETKEISGAF